MIQQKRKILHLFCWLLLLPSLLLFQNCSQVHFIADGSSDFLKNENNGGGYGGKPDGDFYRFVPDFTCENQESFHTHIRIAESGVTLSQNRKTQCATSGTSLDPSLLDTSIYQNEILGYKEGIFEAQSVAPTKIPANLVEVWCRDSKDQSGIETITHYDRNSQLAVTRIHYSMANSAGEMTAQLIADFPVARLVNNRIVTVRNDSGFELVVNRDAPAAEIGLFQGHLKAVISGQSIERETACRLGGSLDATVWPVQQVVDANVSLLKISPDQTRFSYLTTTNAAPTKGNLFLSDLNGQQRLVSASLSTVDNQFQFTSDAKRLVYMVDGSNPTDGTLISAKVDGTSSAVIGTSLMSSTIYMTSADGQTLIYNSGRQMGSWIKSIAIDGTTTPIDLTAFNTAPIAAPTTVQTMVGGRYDISHVGSKIAFICCNSVNQLYSSNLDGSGLKNITPTLPTGYIVDGVRFLSAQSDQLLWVTAWSDANKGSVDYMQYIMRIDGTLALPMLADWSVSSISPSEDYAILMSDKNRSVRRLANLRTGVMTTLPALWPDPYGGDAFFFSRDSSQYMGVPAATTNGSRQAVSISTATGQSSTICPAISPIAMREIRPGTFMLVSADATSKIFRIYLNSATENCRLVNSFPFTQDLSSTVSIQISPDTQKILLQHQNQLFYVPLNGKPAYQINTPVFSGALISNFYFLSDSSTVLYLGDQIQKGENQVFLWKAP